MIELPEAMHLAEQMRAALTGKRIVEALRGNAAMKFAFYSGEPDFYAATLAGKTLGAAQANGNRILLPAEPGYLLVFGEGGERITLHADARSVPARHQLLLRFADDTCLSLTIQMWGAALLLREDELAAHPLAGKQGLSPLSAEFTRAHFHALFAALPPEDKRAIKFFIISEPGVWGVGNGYLQDILFRARLHPRRRAVSLSLPEQDGLYDAIRAVLSEAVSACGRDSELDLFGQPGGYRRALSAETLGKPCPVCAAPIEKIQFLGGASYFCPCCQPLEAH